MSAVHTDVSKRHDAVLLFDVTDGNPNGDPDAGNLPRVDPETMQGLVTDVAIKRKIRNYVDARHGTEERNKIYVQDKGISLNEMHERAYTSLNLKSTGTKQARSDVDLARQWMCDNYYDVRTFGAVMTTGVNAGQVRGPIQLTFARSFDQIIPLDLSITRVAVTRADDAKVTVAEGGEGNATGGKRTEMGRKALVPYGLYRSSIFVSPQLAAQTGFNDDDLALFWEALIRMWDFDRSAARGLMACRGLYVFTHQDPYGTAPAHRLLELISAARQDAGQAVRSFSDYQVKVNGSLPEGVTLTRLEG